MQPRPKSRSHARPSDEESAPVALVAEGKGNGETTGWGVGRITSPTFQPKLVGRGCVPFPQGGTASPRMMGSYEYRFTGRAPNNGAGMMPYPTLPPSASLNCSHSLYSSVFSLFLTVTSCLCIIPQPHTHVHAHSVPLLNAVF